MSHIFISHVEEDADIAVEVANGLEAAGFRTWHYERDTIPGDSYMTQIIEAIEQCKALVLVISPRSLGSRQVRQEVVNAFEKNKSFFPVLHDITHEEFQKRQPEWQYALGATASISISAEGTPGYIARIIDGFKSLSIQPDTVHARMPAPESDSGTQTQKATVHSTAAAWTGIEGERKQATVLFARISRSSSGSGKLDSEEAQELVGECLDLFSEEINSHDGTTLQLLGNELIAVFGLPTAIEDAPQKAVNTAIEMRNKLNRFSKDNNIPLQINIGINSGTVLVRTAGDGSRKENSVMGDTVNLASHLQDASETGQILAGPGTYRSTKNDFDYNKIKSVHLKDKSGPASVYELLSVKEKIYRPDRGSDRMINSEMVGRDDELSRLELHVMKAVNGEGSIVNVIGEAGIGKSRLMLELRNRDAMKRVTLLEGRAISIGRNLSFHPIIDLIRHWAGIREDDGETSAFGRLESAIRRVHPEEADEIIPFVATLTGMKLTGKHAERIKGIEGEALQKLIMKNMRDLLEKAAELTPLVIRMEDIHWADTSSLELMESLFRLVKTQRILFINVFRPDYQETGESLRRAIKEKYPGYCTEINLQPLDENESEELIGNLLNIKGLPRSIREQIQQRAGGNPFFIEEVIRSFIDEGAVIQKRDKYEVTEKIDSVIIPYTINEVLMARIDHLEDETKDLVKVASVIGRSFFFKILNDVAGIIEDIDTRLSHLKDVQLIRDRVRMEELEYLFKHALAQEAAYESILLQKRREIHLKVADSIEKVFQERLHEFYGMLAYHNSRGDDLIKAEEYMIKAGEEALKSSASSEALHYYQEALKLYQNRYGDKADAEKVAMLEKNIALAYFCRGQFAEAAEYFTKVQAFYGVKELKLSVSGIFRIIFNLLNYLTWLYLPFFRGKKIPSDRNNEMGNLANLHGQCLSQIDGKRYFLHSITHLRQIRTFDISQLNNGVTGLVGGSILFSWGGISFSLSRKILEVGKEKVNKND
ncbi:MAG: AAA family ATPase, partial [bacterium]|nr:AAA family ATPase [bacterium]